LLDLVNTLIGVDVVVDKSVNVRRFSVDLDSSLVSGCESGAFTSDFSSDFSMDLGTSVLGEKTFRELKPTSFK
jgi:hypothetical protein